jgi:hypothetical protein
MIRPPRVVTAAAVLATAAAVLLTGCSSGSSGSSRSGANQAATGPSAGPSSSAAGPHAPNADPTTQPADPASDSVPSGPKVPKAELTPVTGTFTKKQKSYLTGRVPKGTDPAAILQLGQETCDRIASVAKIDRDAAVGGIITGQIGGAKGAVTDLCTAQQSVLDDAEHGFADGSYTVGSKAKPGSVIVPGTYRALTPTKDCAWHLGGKSGTAHKVTIRSGDKSFTSNGCFAWAPAGGN